MKEKINQTAGRLKQTVRAVGVGIATLTASFFMSAPAYAAGVQDSQIVKGTEKLVGDVTTWLMVLAPVVAGLLTVWHGSMENCLTRTERSRSTTARITNTFWTLPSRFRQGVVTT